MAGDDELLPVDDKDIFAAAIGAEPPAEPDKPKTEPELKDQKPRDEAGRFVSKAPDAETPEKPEPQKQPPLAAEPVAKEQPGEKSSPEEAIPSWRLREETQRRREAEERLAAREAQLQQLFHQQRQQQPPEQLPDLIEDPQGYAAAIERRIFGQFEQREIARSLFRADQQHGDEFRKAYEEFNSPHRANDTHLLARVKNSIDPGAEIMRWYREQTTLREIGPDPVAYRQKIEAEAEARLLADPAFRQKAMDAWRTEASRRPSSVTPLPNLTRAPGSAGMSEETLPVSDADFFADAIRPMQRRR